MNIRGIYLQHLVFRYYNINLWYKIKLCTVWFLNFRGDQIYVDFVRFLIHHNL